MTEMAVQAQVVMSKILSSSPSELKKEGSKEGFHETWCHK